MNVGDSDQHSCWDFGAASKFQIRCCFWTKRGQRSTRRQCHVRRMDQHDLQREARCSGVLGGLVAITAGCGNVMSWSAIVIGFLGGIVYMNANNLCLRSAQGGGRLQLRMKAGSEIGFRIRFPVEQRRRVRCRLLSLRASH